MTTHASSDRLCRICLLIAAIGLAVLTFGQWSSDPATPMVVSTNVGVPDKLTAMPDGSGGWYAFWRDKRNDGTRYDVYGQRFDAGGNALWAANGAVVHHLEGEGVVDYTVVRLDNGNMMLITISGPATFTDTMRAVLLDAEAQPLWDQPVVITQEGSPILGLDNLAAFATSDGVILGWYDTYFGGSNGVNVARITEDGELLWTENGHAIPWATYGPFNILPDGADGAMVIWRTGNGLGAGFQAMRVDSTGANSWPANLPITPNGNGFTGNHVLSAGPDGSVLMTYTGVGYKAQLLALDTAGTLLFDPSPTPVCDFASSQGQVSMVHVDGTTTVVWGDNRPPASNHDVYMQRFDAQGNMLLDEDGVFVMHLNTYIPTTGLVPSLNGGVIATIDGNVAGYSAMRMHADGTPAWPGPVAFCTNTSNPFYERQLQFADGEGGIVSFWCTNTNTIHGARIHVDGSLGSGVGMAEPASADILRLQPNPATDRVALFSGKPLSQPVVFGADGRIVEVPIIRQEDVLSLDVSMLGSGLYTAVVNAGNVRVAQRFLKQ